MSFPVMSPNNGFGGTATRVLSKSVSLRDITGNFTTAASSESTRILPFPRARSV